MHMGMHRPGMELIMSEMYEVGFMGTVTQAMHGMPLATIAR